MDATNIEFESRTLVALMAAIVYSGAGRSTAEESVTIAKKILERVEMPGEARKK